jgi:adenylate cyclase
MGIATGPAVAGVIGSKRFIYDVWGDTVNIASRLSDDGKKGEILTDKTTYNRLRQQYVFDESTLVNIKGKGEMAIYSLKSKIPLHH